MRAHAIVDVKEEVVVDQRLTSSGVKMLSIRLRKNLDMCHAMKMAMACTELDHEDADGARIVWSNGHRGQGVPFRGT